MEEAGLETKAQKVRDAFYKVFQHKSVETGPDMWPVDVFEDDEVLGTVIIMRDGSENWAIPYKMVDDKITFEARDTWRKVKQPEPAWSFVLEENMEEFAESSSGRAMKLVEVDQAEVVPLHLEVALIEPGFGNKRDNHYYPKEVLARDAKVFEGTKMYESDHGPKNTRLWVSTIKEIKGFTESGAPIGLVSIHDPNFATRIMALDADGLLEKMECSILANGKAKKGKADGRKTKIVEAITEADSVDFVTRAGAGGRALSLAETEEGNMSDEPKDTDLDEGKREAEKVNIKEGGNEEPQETFLEASAVKEALDKTNLPDASKARLSEADYQSEQELSDAVQEEIAYVKKLVGSGKPFGQGPSEKSREDILKERDMRFDRIMKTVGLEV
ncbi:MAG: hypothetical protein JRI36_12795 [Deltaproteobacteria bacterium]|nr:hypothetical protein [Deltaproteobacteria bacterium]